MSQCLRGSKILNHKDTKAQRDTIFDFLLLNFDFHYIAISHEFNH